MIAGSGPRPVIVVGTGRFAQDLCQGLATGAGASMTIHVVGRSRQRAAEATSQARALAAASGRGTSFVAHADEGDHEKTTAALLDATAASVVVNCASQQSPWEAREEPSAWTEVLSGAGFALTVPLQAAIAVAVARACAMHRAGPALVNAAYPDVVNPVLVASGLSVLCGVGNVAALEAYVRSAFGLAEASGAHVLGHHMHLSAPADPGDDVRVWVQDERVDARQALAEARRRPRAELNAVSALLGARLVSCLLSGEAYVGSLPGPHGLPGGYPVEWANGALGLRIPTGESLESMQAWNRRMGAIEGVEVTGTQVTFSPRVSQSLAPWWPDFPAVLDVSRLDEVSQELLRLRSTLRRRPAGTSARHGVRP